MTTPVPPHLSDEERALWEKADAVRPTDRITKIDADFIEACSPAVIRSLLTALSSEREAGERDAARIDALAALLDVEGGAAFGVFLDGSWKIETDNDDFSGTGLRDVLDRLPAPSTETPHA